MMLALIVKVTATAALALLGARLARGSRAALRHAMLAAAFGVLLLMPVVALIAPSVRIAAPVAPTPATRTIAADAPALPLPSDTPTDLPALPPTRLSLSGLLLPAWIFGSTLCLLPMFAGLWQVRNLRRSAIAWRSNQSGVEILLSDQVAGPVTCGALHPAIILPADAQTWSEADLSRALVHELEHVRRRDWIIHCLARTACALYWFHPLVWIARRKLALEAERACDDAVLSGSEATAYADQLVGLARRLSTTKSPLLAMANRTDLTTRVGAVLDSGQRRGRIGRLTIAIAGATAALLVAGIAPLIMVAKPQPQENFEAASIRPASPLGLLGLRSDQHGGPGTSDPGIFTCRNCSLYWVLSDAWKITPYNFSGPDWLQSARFDFSAKIPTGATKEEFQQMLRNLFAERFRMTVHHEMRPMQVYELTIGKNGPKFKESAPTPEEPPKDDGTPPKIQLDTDGFPILGPDTAMTMIAGHGRMRSQNQPIAWFAEMLSNQLRSPITDATELTGKYDFTVSWQWDEGPETQSDYIASLASAVQSQLGLRLERKKGQGDVLVVDHIEKAPTEN